MKNWTWTKAEYPFEHTAREKWNTILLASVLMSVVTLLLRPYGFAPFDRIQLFGSYLFIAFFTLAVNYFCIAYFFPSSFTDDRWSIPKAFLFFTYNFMVIGFWIHVINAYLLKPDPAFMVSGQELLISLVRAISIGLVISGLLILIRYNILTKNHLLVSQRLNQQLRTQLNGRPTEKSEQATVRLFSENKSAAIELNGLQYISSQGNYLACYYQHRKSRTPILLRGRIKQLEEALKEYPSFFRCHRSFIVNLSLVESTSGNSQGLHLKLFDVENRIPVARPKIKLITQRLTDLE
ncbi:MAG: LytTR family DNA-binding domain-containing protein [Bacteroidota bacterium]